VDSGALTFRAGPEPRQSFVGSSVRVCRKARYPATGVRVWVYTVVHNESFMIRYFMRHYSAFAERIIVYDDTSTDGTADLATAAGAEVRPCPWVGLDDLKVVEFASKQYVEARDQADWVIWADVDEFIYDADVLGRLRKFKYDGVTIPTIDGYSMVAEHPPSTEGQIYDEIRRGFPDRAYSKRCVVDPRIDVAWGPGRHEIYADSLRLIGQSDCGLKLLHYRYLGAEWHLARNARNYGRLTPVNKVRMHGQEVYPGYDGLHSPRWYADQVALATDCVSPAS